jgi:hypothetical protein
MCVVGERIGFTLVEILYWHIRAAKSLPPEKSRQEGTLTLKKVVKVVDIGNVRVKIMSDASGSIDLMMDDTPSINFLYPPPFKTVSYLE